MLKGVHSSWKSKMQVSNTKTNRSIKLTGKTNAQSNSEYSNIVMLIHKLSISLQWWL
jgi:hypothetical protein